MLLLSPSGERAPSSSMTATENLSNKKGGGEIPVYARESPDCFAAALAFVRSAPLNCDVGTTFVLHYPEGNGHDKRKGYAGQNFEWAG